MCTDPTVSAMKTKQNHENNIPSFNFGQGLPVSDITVSEIPQMTGLNSSEPKAKLQRNSFFEMSKGCFLVRIKLEVYILTVKRSFNIISIFNM